MIVSVLADRPHYKAGGTDPFEAPAAWPHGLVPFAGGVPPWNLSSSRTAYRHGGALPWTLVREGKTTPRVTVNGGVTTFTVGTITAPTDTAYYLLEKVGVASTDPDMFFAGSIGGSIRGAANITGGFNYTYTPDSKALFFLPAAPLIEQFAHPGHPLLGATVSHGPAGEITLGLATECSLVKAGVTALNIKTLGSQVQYLFKIAGLGYTFSNLQPALFPATFPPPNKDHSQYPMTCIGGAWTADDTQDSLAPRSTNGIYQMTGAIRNGWTYNANIDPQTGAVTTIVSVPEPNVVAASVLDEFANNNGGSPAACAMTWSGARKIVASADCNGLFGLSGGAAGGILRWRPANPWKFVMHLRRVGWAFGQPALNDWTAGAAAGQLAGIVHPTDFIQPQQEVAPPFIFGRLNLFRGLRARDSVAVAGGWNTLATFAFPNATTQVDGVMGGTLPTVGQEIIISGESGYLVPPFIGPPMKTPISFVLFPEASPTPVALGEAMGGVLQGGSP